MELSNISVAISGLVGTVSVYAATQINLIILWAVVSPFIFLALHKFFLRITEKYRLSISYLFLLCTLIFILSVWYIYTNLIPLSRIFGFLMLIGSIPLFSETRQKFLDEFSLERKFGI